MAQLLQRLGFDLPYPLPRDAANLPNLFECALITVDAEALADNEAFPRLETVEFGIADRPSFDCVEDFAEAGNSVRRFRVVGIGNPVFPADELANFIPYLSSS
jgi:hypothetical protein